MLAPRYQVNSRGIVNARTARFGTHWIPYVRIQWVPIASFGREFTNAVFTSIGYPRYQLYIATGTQSICAQVPSVPVLHRDWYLKYQVPTQCA